VITDKQLQPTDHVIGVRHGNRELLSHVRPTWQSHCAVGLKTGT